MQARQIEIGGILTHDEWGLILTDYQIGEAEPKLEHIDVPFADGKIEISEAITGEVKYNNRELTFTFDLLTTKEKWSNILSDIRNRLHGQRITVKIPDDPGYYYSGRVIIDSIKKSGVVHQIIFTVDAEPYKKKNNITKVQKTATKTGWMTVPLKNERQTTQVKVTNTHTIKINNGETTFTLNAGAWYPSELIIKGGTNNLQVYADENTHVLFEYEEGAL